MGFTIPNAPDASVVDQSEPDSVDFQALGNRSSGVVSGCAVTAAATPDQTVLVAAGEVISNGVYRTVSSTTLSLGQGDSSSARFDLVVVNAAGTVVARTGTAGSNATFPTLTSGDVLLAAVYRAAGTGDTITNSRIIDKAITQPSNVVRSGSGTPSNSLGSIGDIYVNTALSSNSGQSQVWVKMGATSWENLAEYTFPVSTSNTGNTIVQRDASGNFSVGTVTATSFSGPLTGNVTGNLTGDVTGNVTGNLTGTASSATLATKASTVSQNGGTGSAMTFNYTPAQSGQPTALWGTNNGTDIYVYNPSNFNVAKASTLAQGGGTGAAMTFTYSPTQSGTPSVVWGTADGLAIRAYSPANFSVNYATSAGNATTAGGLAVHAARNNEANKIVRTDGNGYLQVGYINSSSGNEGNNSNPSRVWGTNGTDDYLRSYLTGALSVNYANSAGSAGQLSNGITLYNSGGEWYTGSNFYGGNQVKASYFRGVPGGGPGLPEYAFTSDVDTGMYNPADGNIRFACNGVARYVINSSGGANVSSRRYKTNINPLSFDSSTLLNIELVTFSPKLEDGSAEETVIAGVIAEQLDEIPACRHFIIYDEDGNPEAVAYDRLAVAYIDLLKNHEERIKALEAKK